MISTRRGMPRSFRKEDEGVMRGRPSSPALRAGCYPAVVGRGSGRRALGNSGFRAPTVLRDAAERLREVRDGDEPSVLPSVVQRPLARSAPVLGILVVVRGRVGQADLRR